MSGLNHSTPKPLNVEWQKDRNRTVQMTTKKPNKQKTPEICPVCGESVPRNAPACPECGADHNSGWREEADTYDGVDLPDDEFNYDEFVKQEFGPKRRSAGLHMVWWIAGILLLVAFLLMYVYAAR